MTYMYAKMQIIILMGTFMSRHRVFVGFLDTLGSLHNMVSISSGLPIAFNTPDRCCVAHWH